MLEPYAGKLARTVLRERGDGDIALLPGGAMNTEQGLRNNFEGKLPACLARAAATRIVPIIPNHHFSVASSEIRDMYIEGYFNGAIALSQSVAEGLSKFVCKRKHVRSAKNHLTRVEKLRSEKIITEEANAAFKIIEDGRNEFHHMNEEIVTNNSVLEQKAKQNVEKLFDIEDEIFRHSFDKGKLVPANPEFWDIKQNGTTEVFLRFPT